MAAPPLTEDARAKSTEEGVLGGVIFNPNTEKTLSIVAAAAQAGRHRIKLGFTMPVGELIFTIVTPQGTQEERVDAPMTVANSSDFPFISSYPFWLEIGQTATLTIRYENNTNNDTALLDHFQALIDQSAQPSISLISPENNAIGELEEVTLSWTSAGIVTYDVWFGPTGNMTKVSSAQTGLTYVVSAEPGTEYQWKITTNFGSSSVDSETRTFRPYFWGMTNSLITDAQAATVNALDYRLDTTPIIECYPTTNGTTGWRPNTAGIIDARLEKLSGEWVWKHVVDEQYASGNQRSLMRCSLPTHTDLFGKFATNTGNKNVPAGKIQIQGGLYNPGPGQMKTSGICYLQGDTEMQLEFDIMFPAGTLGNLNGTPTATSWLDNTFTSGFFCQGLVRGSTYSTPGPDFFIGLNFQSGELRWYFGEIGLADPPGSLINNSTFSLCRNSSDQYDIVKMEEERWYHMVVNVCTSRSGKGFTRYLIDGNLMHANNNIILSRGHASDPTHFPDDTTIISIGGYWSGLGAAQGGHSPPRIATHYTRNHMISKVGLNTSGSPA